MTLQIKQANERLRPTPLINSAFSANRHRTRSGGLVRGAFARVRNALRERDVVATSVELMTSDDDTLLCRYIPYSGPFDAVACVRGRRENGSGWISERSSFVVTPINHGLFVGRGQEKTQSHVKRPQRGYLVLQKCSVDINASVALCRPRCLNMG